MTRCKWKRETKVVKIGIAVQNAND